MSGERPLTRKQTLFVEAYCGEAAGNATEAARLAGYAGNDVTLGQVGAENLKKPQISKAIIKRDLENPRIKSPDEIREFWSSMMDDYNATRTEKLTAARDLARSRAMFVDRTEAKVDVTFDDEAIRAELARKLPGYARGK